jgi:hypothetical protein
MVVVRIGRPGEAMAFAIGKARQGFAKCSRENDSPSLATAQILTYSRRSYCRFW